MKSLIRFFERHLFGIAITALTCGIIGSYLLSIGCTEPIADTGAVPQQSTQFFLEADPLEPWWRGVKVLWGIDSYKPHWIELKNDFQRVGYVLFEVGRLLGFLVFIRAMFLLVRSSYVASKAESVVRRAIMKGEEVYAVHGDSMYAANLVKNLMRERKSVAVTNEELLPMLGDDAPPKAVDLALALKAPRQVIFYEKDRKCIEFLERNKEEMREDARIYIHIDEFSPEDVLDNQVMIFSIAEICAMQYWEAFPVYVRTKGELGKSQHAIDKFVGMLRSPVPEEPLYRIVIIGSGIYAESILTQGLLSNLFNVSGGVRYDVIGNVERWRHTHPGIDAAKGVNADELHFHNGAWYEHRFIINAADRVILCGDSTETLRITSELLSESVRELHVRANHATSLKRISENRVDAGGFTKVRVFGTMKEICATSFLIQDRMHENGKMHDIIYGLGTQRCNSCATFDFSSAPQAPKDRYPTDAEREAILDARMRCIYKSANKGIKSCLECPRFMDEWSSYNGFLHRSNYAASSHDGQKFRMLRGVGIDVSNTTTVLQMAEAYKRLPEDVRDALQEIEHVRWCRFHFLNGWTYAPGQKNPFERTHPDLLPYAQLESDKSKDADPYLSLCLMIHSREQLRELENRWLRND